MSSPEFEKKIVQEGALQAAAERLARPLVLTNGVFDLLHRGHVTYLAQARMLGASLIVAINSDSSVKLLGKGEDRPVNTEADRAAVIAALQSVDMVTVFAAQVPLSIIQAVRPDVYVKGGDYSMDEIPEAQLARSLGARAVGLPLVHARSTTRLLQQVRSADSRGSKR
jgi:rfaE bifunctional protein nucleotidyltransferase chain/domain